ncbi:MAG: hypothetical protein M0R47_17045 [Methylobacter sp.]|uniref:hypothetical protein n=1 Tax=Methylobacter sp. TaxID=2051955 RepID=UPI0025F74E4C|nr:hypothetical protein [Methylobacter sp.]MCK9622231.1 hypothetical protein [Methylobacter sp.]
MSTATNMLALYIEAEQAVLGGRRYEKNGMKFEREDLAKIQTGRREWQTIVNAENMAANKVPSISIKIANFDVT